MRGNMKSFFSLSTVLVLIFATLLPVLYLTGCATNKESPQLEKTESKPKKEYTKQDFLEDVNKKLQADDMEGALALFETMPEKFREDFGLRVVKASLLFSAERLEESKALCTELSTEDPSNADVKELLALIAQKEGNSKERTKIINEMIAQNPNDPGANIALAQDTIINGKGKARYKTARSYYAKAYKGDPANEDALFGLALTDYFLEEDERAKDELNRLIEKNPSYSGAYYYLGKLAEAENEHLIASRYAKKALDFEPDNYDYLMDWGMYERQLGHFENAENAWSKAISIQDDYFLAYVYRAGLYDEQERFTEAIADYKKVIALKPDYYFAYESIGVLAIHDKDWITAGSAFMKCWQKNPDNISYPLMVTYCYYMLGKDLEAKNFSDKLLRKMNRNSMDYAMLRVWHDKAGEKTLPQRIQKVENSNQRGKMYFYLALLYDMYGGHELAKEYYAKILNMSSPLFFEYRIAEWNAGVTK